MYQNLAVLLLPGILVYGSQMSLSEESQKTLGEFSCKVQKPAVLLQEAMFGNENPEIEDGDEVRRFVISDASLQMAVIENFSGSDTERSRGTIFNVSRSGESLDFTRQEGMYLTLNYELDLSDGKIVYTEITHDAWRAGNSFFFIAKGSCRANLAARDSTEREDSGPGKTGPEDTEPESGSSGK